MDKEFKIEGERINLRTIRQSDIEDYERWNSSNSKAFELDGPWYNEDLSEVIKRRKKLCSKGPTPPYEILEIETDDKVHIGWVCVYHDAKDPHMTEIGISIFEDSYWRKGLGEETLKLWVDYLFKEKNFTRLGFETWSGNKGMIRLGEKLGFIKEGIIRKGCEVKGIFHDRVKMGILREEWESNNSLE